MIADAQGQEIEQEVERPGALRGISGPEETEVEDQGHEEGGEAVDFRLDGRVPVGIAECEDQGAAGSAQMDQKGFAEA